MTARTLLGLPVWSAGRQALLDHLRTLPGLHALHSVNAEIAVQSLDHPGLRAALQRNPTNLIDGEGVRKLLRLKYGGRCERISGSDLVYELARLCGAQRWPLLLLGGSRSSGRAARDRLAALGADVSWHELPQIAGDELGDADRQAVRERIVAGRIAAVVVCLGAPKQELWIERERPWLERHGVRVCLSAGGSIDFVAGAVRRAPPWVSRLGAEWLFRLLQEPRRRLHRMLTRLPRFLARALPEALAHRFGWRRVRAPANADAAAADRAAAVDGSPAAASAGAVARPSTAAAELVVLRMERHAVEQTVLYGETSFVHWLDEAQRLLPLTLVARGVPRTRLQTAADGLGDGIALGPGCRFVSTGPARGILGALLGAPRIALALCRARRRSADVLLRMPEHASFVTAPLLWLLRFRLHVWVVADRQGMRQAALAGHGRLRRLAIRCAYWLNARAERRLLRRARTLFVNGSEALRQFGDAPRPEPVVLVSSTISRAHVAWAQARREATPPPPGPAALRGLCVARLSPEKGHDFLFECLREAAAAALPMQLRLVGFEDPGHGDRLRRLAAELGIAQAVEFTGGVPFGPRLLEHYVQSDVVLLLSRMEGTPRVLAEAYMLGLPILATRVGGIVTGYADLEHEGVYLIPFGDRAAFVQALGKVAAWVAAGRPPLPRAHDRTVAACVRTMLERIQRDRADELVGGRK